MSKLNGYELKKFKQRRRESGISEVTLKNNPSTLRTFLNWCAEAQAVEPGLSELVQLPTSTPKSTPATISSPSNT